MRFEADTWERTTLGKLCERGDASIQIGVRINTEGRGDAGIPYVMPQNFRDYRIDPTTVASAFNVRQQDRLRHSVQCGDILCCRRGDVDRYAIVGEKEAGWLCGTGCLRLRFHPDRIDPFYAFYYLRHPDVCSWLKRHAVGATMPNLNKSILQSMPFVIPPVTEQRSIAALLRSLEDKIALTFELNRNLISASRCAFQAIIKTWTPFETPEMELSCGCSVQPLSKLCDRLENGRTPPRNNPRFWNGNVPWLTSSEVRQPVIAFTENQITRAGLLENKLKLWPQGTVVIAMFGSTAAQVSWLAIESSANQACCGLVLPPALQLYIHQYMTVFAPVLRKLAKGSAQQNLNQQTIAQFPILVPDAETLQKYDEHVRPFYEQIAGNVRECATLSKLRDTILPQLFAAQSQSLVS